MVILKKKEHY